MKHDTAFSYNRIRWKHEIRRSCRRVGDLVVSVEKLRSTFLTTKSKHWNAFLWFITDLRVETVGIHGIYGPDPSNHALSFLMPPLTFFHSTSVTLFICLREVRHFDKGSLSFVDTATQWREVKRTVPVFGREKRDYVGYLATARKMYRYKEDVHLFVNEATKLLTSIALRVSSPHR